MDKNYAQYLVKKTISDYDTISEHFSNTRSFMWQDLEFIKKYISNGDKVLDLGCGNGRLIDLLKDLDIKYVGIDSSEKLISLAKQKYPKHEFLKANALKLPFKDNSFVKGNS